MNLFGGSTEQVDTYSNAAGSVITPHVLGDDKAIRGPGTTWDSVADNTRLIVSFGGMPLKNLQIEAGGTGEHSSITAIGNLAGRGIEFVCISPIRADYADELKAEWLPAIPGTDTAIMLGLAHTLRHGRTPRRGVSRTLHGRLREISRAISWARRTDNRRMPPGRRAFRASMPRRSAVWRGGWPQRAPSSRPPGRCSVPTMASSRSG